MIQIQSLKKYYGRGENRQAVLKGIDLSVPQGSITCILGPSGSGKSTLLNILGGIETIDEGTVTVDHFTLNGKNKRALENYRRKNIGFVFQFYNLVSNLTVRENIEVGAYLSDEPLNVDEVSEHLGIADQLGKFPNELSGGQAQRTSIARAMIKRPALLLCDEPTGALDYESAKSVLKLIEYLNQEYGISVLLASHNQQIAKMCDTVVELHDGRLKNVRGNEHKISAEEVTW